MSVPATQPRLRRYFKAVAPLAILVLLAVACSSDGFPESYSDQIDEATGLSNVEANWREGCEVGLADSDLAGDANAVCACSFQEISTTIPFDDFIELDNQLKGDPTSLANGDVTGIESSILEIVRGCIAGS